MTAMRPETTSEHIARDMREGRFPERSEPQMVADLAAATPELKTCPFCGCDLVTRHTGWLDHPKAKCILSGKVFHKGFIGQWNRRADLPPTLSAALARIAELEAAACSYQAALMNHGIDGSKGPKE